MQLRPSPFCVLGQVPATPARATIRACGAAGQWWRAWREKAPTFLLLEREGLLRLGLLFPDLTQPEQAVFFQLLPAEDTGLGPGTAAARLHRRQMGTQEREGQSSGAALGSLCSKGQMGVGWDGGGAERDQNGRGRSLPGTRL